MYTLIVYIYVLGALLHFAGPQARRGMMEGE